MADSPKSPPEIPEPTRDDLLRLAHAEYRDQLASGQLRSKVAEPLWDALRKQWFEGHEAARTVDGRFKDIQPDELKDLELQTDADRAVESLEKNRVQSPEEHSAIISEERTQEDRGKWERLGDPEREREWREEQRLRRREKLLEREEALRRNERRPLPRDHIADLLDQSAERRREEREERLLRALEQQNMPYSIANELLKQPSINPESGSGSAPPSSQDSPSDRQSPWHKDRDLVFAAVCVCVGIVAGIILWLAPSKNPLVVGLALVVMFLLLAFSAGLVGHYFDRLRFAIMLGIPVSALLTFGFGTYVWPSPPPQPKPEIVNVIPAPTPVPSPKLLHEYFEEETLNGLPKTIPEVLKVKNESVNVEKRFYMDFNNKTSRLAFYISDTGYTPEVCLRLLNEHQATIRQFVQAWQGKIEMGPIEGRQTEVKDLRFTGYIIFYHESLMNQSERDSLTARAKSAGLAVEFRSQQYVLARWK